MSKIFAQVLLPLALDEPFSYTSKEEVEAGDVVLVQFGKQEIWGVVFSTSATAPENFPEAKMFLHVFVNPEHFMFEMFSVHNFKHDKYTFLFLQIKSM